MVRLGYATGDEVMRAIAKEHGLDFIDLNEVVIPPSVVELVPESVARENAILPMAEEDGALKVIVSDPLDLDTFEKLRFILNRKIDIALAPRENILEAINRHYGQMEAKVPTRCSRSSPTRPSTLRKPNETGQPATSRSTKATPRSSGWCN